MQVYADGWKGPWTRYCNHITPFESITSTAKNLYIKVLEGKNKGYMKFSCTISVSSHLQNFNYVLYTHGDF